MSDSWKDRRVVITGLGVVNSLGFTADSFWQKLIAGECGIGMVTQFDASDYSCRIAAEVRDFDPSPAFPSPKDIRRTDRFVQFGVYAGYQALLDSGMDLESLDRDRIGTYIGSGIGGLFTTEEQHKILLNRGPKRVSPFMIPMLILNMASGIFSI
ncbi:MAG TPA: beta-ketoacyl-[acyl-carrier-protein] synthase II, partial [Verrucomicrobia bacterium]|nr:beta-ketoacyl-[acyl-carrier-protein] synthase II [Verrucomicrobiota bacterium]